MSGKIAENSRGAEICGRKLPVNELVDYLFDVVRALVLEIEVVGVLPHVNHKQRFHVRRERIPRIVRLHDC